MKKKQYYYVNNDLHDLTAWKFVKNDKSNTLKSDKMNQVLIDLFDMSDKTNDIDKTIFQQNFKVLLNIINKNISILFEIQIY